MKQFTELYLELDSSNSSNAKLHALKKYFLTASDDDKLRALAILSGRRSRRIISAGNLREWAAEMSGLPLWLFEETYHIVGDLAETIARVIPPSGQMYTEGFTRTLQILEDLRQQPEEFRKETITSIWIQMTQDERFVFNKLLTGGFRVGVSDRMVIKALTLATGRDENVLAHRLMGNWTPESTDFQKLIFGTDDGDDNSRPYPFCLAYPMEEFPDNSTEWMAEYKWDGIRGQLIRRGNRIWIWSRGEELVTDQYPELVQMGDKLPDGTVLDGEIIAWKDGKPMPFQKLQKRLGRKVVSRKLMTEIPVSFIAYDILEINSIDIRQETLMSRRQKLENLLNVSDSGILLSESIHFAGREELEKIRLTAPEKGSEGLMLKRLDSVYKVGRKRGDWWKWKVDPYTIDAVMIYAQSGHGRRAGLYTDFTFAVKNGEELVPFAKAYSGLTDVEMREVDAFVKQHTIERFGPVRSVEPLLVFEIGFEGIAESSRHKSGIALRFPRILRIRKDKKPDEINSLDDLRKLLRSTF